MLLIFLIDSRIIPTVKYIYLKIKSQWVFDSSFIDMKMEEWQTHSYMRIYTLRQRELCFTLGIFFQIWFRKKAHIFPHYACWPPSLFKNLINLCCSWLMNKKDSEKKRWTFYKTHFWAQKWIVHWPQHFLKIYL